MRIDTSTVGIAPGEGLIARFGDVVIYLVGANASTERVLGAVEAVADTEHPGAAIAARLASVVFGGGSEPPPFGLVAPTADGTLVLLRGPVSAVISGAEGERRLVGARAFTWVDEIVRDAVRTLTVGPGADAQVTPYPRTDLRRGVVPGGGFVLHAAVRRRPKKSGATMDRKQPPVSTAPAGLAAAGRDGDRNGGGEKSAGQSADEPVTPEPLPGTQAWSAAPGPLRPKSDRIQLRKQSVPPRAPVSGGNGAQSMPQSAPQTGPALVADDGTAYPLDRPYVIGRGPSVDESIRRKTATPLILQRDRHISRVHAYLSVEAGKAGTFITTPDDARWTRIDRSPTELPPGGRIRISEQVLTYHPDHPQPAD